MIETLELAPDLKIPRVLMGLWQIADLERNGRVLDPVATSKHMIPYVEAGFTTFDMADHYGSAEVIAGHFKKNEVSGPKARLLTKWVPKPGAVTQGEVRGAVELSLDRMQADRLDMLQYHTWNYADPAWLDSLFWLQELKEEGLIGHLGLVNFDAAHLRMAVASGIEILTNQVSYSLLDQRAAGDMAEVCRQHGVKILAFGILAGGFLTEKWLGKPEPATGQLATWSQMKYKRFIEAAGGWPRLQGVLQALDDVARKHGVSMSTIASRYMLGDHAMENLAIFELSLDRQDREVIQQAVTGLDPIPGACGDEYRKPPFLTASGDLSDHFDSIPPVFSPRSGSDGKSRVLSGTMWERFAGYCRAVRSGERIFVSGTTATHGERLIGGRDPAAQTHFVIDKIKAAIESLGGKLEDVDRTRIYVNDISHWEPVARAHGERFGHILPANTLVESKLVGEEFLVEMEAEARVQE
jgi:aryl-alcohol dehydrogenase-like predicted oxidoreductase/enamine deaminase RidA (YjgF/YER057c/UK114 family)